MIDTAYQRFCCLQKQMETDPDYIGICGELEQRMLEIACFTA